ncbi:MAG: DUF6067 family protein [Candidatus Omnitrophica bacterium]|nr:DUF6067 family protein [Candidatus Omnitrophota bacterium]
MPASLKEGYWVFFLLALQAFSATSFLVFEPLDSIPASARIERREKITSVAGRLPGQKAINLEKGTMLTWEITEKPEQAFVEFWVKPAKPEQLTLSSGFPMLSLVKGITRYSLEMEKGQTGLELVLTRGSRKLISYPIYQWLNQTWIKQERDFWHYLCLVLEKQKIYLWVDGFQASQQGAPANPEPITELSLSGGPAAFSSLIVSRNTPIDIRARYRSLYRGLPEILPNIVTVPFLTKPPVIDGRISPGEWEKMTRLGDFCSLREKPGYLKREKIEAYLGYDRENLYLMVRTPYTGKLDYRTWKMKDGSLTGEESYEIFVHPPLTDLPEIYQFVGNPAGNQMDLKSLDINWNGRWYWKTMVAESEWLAEFSAPFRGIGLSPPAPGDLWSFNMVNTKADAGWCWTQRYNDTGSFGRIRFGKDSLAIQPGHFKIEAGKITVVLGVSGSSQPRTLVSSLQVYSEGDILPRAENTRTLDLKTQESLRETLTVWTADLSTGRVVLSVNEGKDCLYYQSLLFPEAPVTERKSKAQKQTETAKERPDTALEKEEQAYKRKWSAQELGQTLLEASEWKKANVGITDKVPPPWSPLRVENQTVHCWGRSYQYQNSLFPARIISQDKVLVETPPYLILRGKKREYRLSAAEVEMEKINDGLVKVKTRTTTGPFSAEVTTDYEFDGMAKSELSLTCLEAPSELSRISLVIPLNSQYCRLYHYSASISGHAPASDSGYLSKKGFSLDFLREIVWIGDNWTGFSWFTESLENWPLKDEKNIQSLSQAGQENRLFTVKFGDKPLFLQKPLRLVFGFAATPVKPRPTDFRNRSWSESVDWCWFWGDGQYYPFLSNPEKARQQVEKARSKGKQVMPCSSITFHGLYRFYESYFGLVDNPGLKHRAMLLFEPIWRQTTIYSPLSLPADKHTADGLWFGKKFQPQGLTSLCAASDFQDYYLCQLAKLVKETGLTAIYLDQPLYRCSNPHHGCGYINYRGEWTPRMPIWAMRNMLKRMYNVFVESHGQSFIRWHSSNQIPVFLISFIDTFWDGENYGSGPQKVFEFYSQLLSEGKMQAQHTGLQFGFYPDLLPEFEDRYAPTPASIYDMMGLFMVHDSTVWPAHCRYPQLVKLIQEKRFSFPLEKMKVAYYWEKSTPVAVRPERVKWIFHYGQEKNLLVLFNWSDHWQTAQVRFSPEFLSNTPLVAIDLLTGEKIPWPLKDTLILPICSRDLRLIEINATR